jgi:hypothetical protein
LQKTPLGVVVYESQCAMVGLAGVFGASEPTEQLASRCVEIAVVLEVELLDHLERLLWSLRFGDRDGEAELDNGRAVSRASSPSPRRAAAKRNRRPRQRHRVGTAGGTPSTAP